MYYRLIQIVRGHCLRILRPIEAGNGFEAWRVLVQDMQKLEEGQSVGLMQQMIDFTFDPEQDYEKQLSQLDTLVEMYRRQHGEASVPDEMLKAVVIRGAPEALRTHLQLLRVPTYRDLKKTLIQFLQAQAMWERTSTEQGQQSLSVLEKGKGKGKGKKGKSKTKTWAEGESEMTCFNCRGYGHVASQCPSSRRERSAWPAPQTAPKPTLEHLEQDELQHPPVTLIGEDDDYDWDRDAMWQQLVDDFRAEIAAVQRSPTTV